MDFLPAISLDFAIADAEAKVMSVKLKALKMLYNFRNPSAR